MKTLGSGLIFLAVAPLLSGCVAAAVTGAVVKTTGAVVGTAAKTTGKVVGAVIPDGENQQGGAYAPGPGYAAAPSAGSSGGGYTRADAINDARNLR